MTDIDFLEDEIPPIGEGEPWSNGHDLSPLFAIDPTTLHGLPIPPRQWLVPDWIPLSRATSLYGAGGESKTLLAQMLATACAIGEKWLGLPVRQCNSLLMFCEDDIDEMHRRQEDINAHYGCGFTGLGAMRWLPLLGEDNALMVFDAGRARYTPLFEQLLAAAKGHEAGLVLTDTLADVFSGNENDRGQARQFAQAALGHIARATGAVSLTLAHPSFTGSANGGTGSGIIASIERKTCERVFFDLLDKITNEGRHVSESNRAPNYAPRLFSQRPDHERFGKRDFERAMQRLFASKKIKVGTYKAADRHPYSCIIPSADGASN